MAGVLTSGDCETGRTNWYMERNDEGHRIYHIVHRVRALISDGPYTVFNTPGLPLTGSVWNFGNDLDPWAYCKPTLRVTPRKTEEPNRYWDVENTFSTEPLSRCQDEEITDPLLEPQKVSGTFVKYTQEAQKDRNDEVICSSSFELFSGPQVEFDHNRPSVSIEQNVAVLELEVFAEMVDTVNSAPLWGLAARCIKLSNVTWERKIMASCGYYYTRKFDFDVDFKTFDRTIRDQGAKALGDWNSTTGVWVVSGDPTDPRDFDHYKDKRGENCRTFLNGSGAPAASIEEAGEIEVEYYSESNFLTLGIPTTF